MKKDSIFSFVWWLTSPFFVVFYFLILMSFFSGRMYLNSFLYLTLLLVTVPLVFDWLTVLSYTEDADERSKVSAVVYLIAFILSYYLFIKIFPSTTRLLYVIFSLQILISYIIRFFKYNQYVFLLGVFFVITILLSILLIVDLYYLIIIQLLFTGFFMRIFIKNEVDTLKNMFLFYLLGIFSTFGFWYLVNFLVKL